MAKVMGRKHMLSKVATAAAEGVDPRDLSKLKTKAFITTFRVTEDWEFTSELKCSNCVLFYLLLFSLSLRKSWVRFSGPWDWLGCLVQRAGGGWLVNTKTVAFVKVAVCTFVITANRRVSDVGWCLDFEMKSRILWQEGTCEYFLEDGASHNLII